MLPLAQPNTQAVTTSNYKCTSKWCMPRTLCQADCIVQSPTCDEMQRHVTILESCSIIQCRPTCISTGLPWTVNYIWWLQHSRLCGRRWCEGGCKRALRVGVAIRQSWTVIYISRPEIQCCTSTAHTTSVVLYFSEEESLSQVTCMLSVNAGACMADWTS